MAFPKKIVNDPIYGFITLAEPLVREVIAHPWYQRLRRIHQMALAQLVYPGAVHTRLHHSMGAYHLMGKALDVLRSKGVRISPEEDEAAKLAILLHDIGHGPYSHALEGTLVPGLAHETLSLQLMEALNRHFGGRLQLAIDIFTNRHHRKFLHQLVSGQLDVDRMDYLNRDSFYTGVSEGVIGYDRILTMLTVHHDELMVEEKAVYSIEKFLVARRLMYWQVYLHKTVLAAEQMLVRIVERAREVGAHTVGSLQGFLQRQHSPDFYADLLSSFTLLDDVDVMMAIKQWQQHPDPVLQCLCRALLCRNLLKIRMQSQPFMLQDLQEKDDMLQKATGWPAGWRKYLVFGGLAQNTTYRIADERIHILYKDGRVRDISEVDHALIQQSLAATVAKHYICWPGPEVFVNVH